MAAAPISASSSSHMHAHSMISGAAARGEAKVSATSLVGTSRIELGEGESPIILHNVCAAVDLGVAFNDQQLGHIAQNCRNCEHKGHKLLITIRSPRASATLFRSGKMVVLGALSATLNHLACRRIARRIQRCGYPVRIRKFMLTNVCGSYEPMETHVSVDLQAIADREVRRGIEIDYEPEIKPALTWQMKDPKSTFNIFANGKMNVVGCSSEQDLVRAFHMVLPVLKRYYREMTEADRAAEPKKKSRKRVRNDTATATNMAATAARRLASSSSSSSAAVTAAVSRPAVAVAMDHNGNMSAPVAMMAASSASSGYIDDGPPPLDRATPAMPPPLEAAEPSTPLPVFQPPVQPVTPNNNNNNNNNNNGHHHQYAINGNGHHTHHHHQHIAVPAALVPIAIVDAPPDVAAAPPPLEPEDFDGWT